MPTRVLTGDRIAKQGRIRIGCSATIFNEQRDRVLLTRRTDNGLWCLPGGGMDPGEFMEETCVREVFEETGLRILVKRLIGIYSSPNWLVEYPDGNRVQIVALNFEAQVIGGEMTTTREVSEYGYFNQADLAALDLMANHHQRILDAFEHQPQAFIR